MDLILWRTSVSGPPAPASVVSQLLAGEQGLVEAELG
jgi:hypothetical protein